MTIKLNPYIRNLLLSMCLLLTGMQALAHSKTDLVTLYNGDRLTGEIKSLRDGKLELATDAMGTLEIEWQEVATVQSDYHYQIKLSDGQRLYGELSSADRPGELTLTDSEGAHKFEGLQMVELRPISERVLERLDVYLSAGYSYTKASSISQVTFNTDVSYENESSRNNLTARVTNTDSDTDSSNSTRLDISRQVWTDRAAYYRGTFANYETNDELALNYRLGAGMGLGRYFIDTNSTSFAAVAGLQVITELGDSGDKTQSVEAILGASYSYWRFDTPELDIGLSLNVYPSLTESGRVRSDTNLRLRWELVNDLYWDITAYGSFDNKSDSAIQVDYGVTTGLGWTY